MDGDEGAVGVTVVAELDVGENDAMLSPKRATGRCFQFSNSETFPISVDRAIILSMEDEATNQRSNQ